MLHLAPMTESISIYPRHFFRNPVARQHTGFILMPFKPEFEPVHQAVRAAIEDAGYKPNDLDCFNPRSTMETILRGIAESEVIVADMTDRNANVFYEVGIAHTVKDNVVLLTQDTEEIPFNSRHISHISYSLDNLSELTKDLTKVLEELKPEPPHYQRRDTASIKRDIRNQLRTCEQIWIEKIIPQQNKVFQDQFRNVNRSKAVEVATESLKVIQRAFLYQWKPIEDLGFEVLDSGADLDAVMPDLVGALSRAYALPKQAKQEHLTVAGHGPLLALRTWTLWGAFALRCADWDAVCDLLHRQVYFERPSGSVSKRESFATHHHFHCLDAPVPRIIERSVMRRESYYLIYDQSDKFAKQHFLDIEEMQGFIGLWLFAAELACATATGALLYPSWAFAPEEQFNRLLERVETDPEYARRFTKAVAGTEPAALNEIWTTKLRDQLGDNLRLGDALGCGLAFRQIPERFAE